METKTESYLILARDVMLFMLALASGIAVVVIGGLIYLAFELLSMLVEHVVNAYYYYKEVNVDKESDTHPALYIEHTLKD